MVGRSILKAAGGKNLRIRAEWKKDAFKSLQRIKTKKRRMVRTALKESAEIFLEEAPKHIGSRPGPENRTYILKNSFKQQTMKDRPDLIQIHAGPSRLAWYAHFLEFGTSHHKKYPFMNPAWNESEDKVRAKFKKEFWDKLKQAAKGNIISEVFGK